MINNKTKTISVVLSVVLIALIIFSLLSFKEGDKPKTETKIVTDTKCFVHQNMSMIKMYVESYSKYGYTVKLITSQNVSISTTDNAHADFNKKEMKGDIILVIEKQTTVTVIIK